MKRLVILISGRGSNMQAIVESALPNVDISAVIANRADAAGLTWARARGIPTHALDHRDYPSREAFDTTLAERIDSHHPDWVVLAGFMRILTPAFTTHYAGRLLNIHPSLLPAFPGLHTHQRALDMGCRVAGCTVHFVTADLDHGPIIAQGVVPVLEDDNAEQLAARVLAVEHQLYPQVLRGLVNGSITLQAGRVRHTASSDADRYLIVPSDG